MKKTIISLCLLVSALVGLSSTVYARGIREDIDYAEEKSRIGYALGMIIGADLESSGLEVNYASFTEGLRAAMEQEPVRFSQEEAMYIVQNAFEAAMERRAEQNRADEAEFLAKNRMRPEVYITPSGLQYEILEEGEGAKPLGTDVVRVHYEGSLVDGTIFDNSHERGEPEIVPLHGVIPGWAEGLQLMNEGSIYRLYIPSYLAYGEQGAGPVIPPSSTLIFVVELLEIVESSAGDY
ncbi:MAG: FKBP-type peptidyl-prolyl cis-trans isomerase [Treponema sp.]|jgi:FKBP-type peptidyl-prolyl cis-trans isomerase|nr:FKBP-type peptidyl-prolyl cis-trans isomerase [Treponema sp.]